MTLITEIYTATELKKMANGYQTGSELVDLVRGDEEREGFGFEIEEDYSESNYNAQNDTLRIVAITCPDGSIARFGHYEDGAQTAIDALDDEDMEQWLQGWISNNGTTQEDLHPLIYQTAIDLGLIDEDEDDDA